MMYMHYCKCCHRIFMLNGHKMICPKCTEPLTELRISYLDYVNLNMQGREELIAACADDEQLDKMKATYRMYKYSKWYKELQRQLAQPAVHSYPASERDPMENAVSTV